MNAHFGIRQAACAGICLVAVAACGASNDTVQAVSNDVQPVAIDAGTPNAISRWNATATATISQPNAATGTPEERNAVFELDLASVHVAMYDALVAIEGRYQPFVAKQDSAVPATAEASQDAAAAAAAYGVLKGLYPSRIATYQPDYDAALAGVSDPAARDKGVAIGAEVAAKVLAARANDGRSTALPAFVAGTDPGEFRGPAIVGRAYPFVRPFTLTKADQFRAPGPRSLASEAYATDVAETAALGSLTSVNRTADQTTIARFHAEAPPVYWPRNLRPFLMTQRSLIDQARLGALIWVSHVDAILACMESKYHFLFWRPVSAINEADTDGNPATAADPAWKPLLPTPPHPEYPAAHGCVSGAMAETVRRFFGTKQVSFDFTSPVTGTTRHYATTDELLDEVTTARIAGGMHFRSSQLDGEALGTSVAGYVADSRFQAR